MKHLSIITLHVSSIHESDVQKYWWPCCQMRTTAEDPEMVL